MTLGFCDCNQGRLPCTCLPAVTGTTPMPACKPPRGESGLRIAAISYSCRNLGQVALMWPGQGAPTGPGWIDVKAEPLVRLSDVETIVRNGEKCVEEYQTVKSSVIAHLQKRVDDYVNEYGSVDPETGTCEFPGNGDEYVGTHEELIDEIRELLK